MCKNQDAVKVLVHLAYLDDSSVGPLAIFGAIVIPSGKWGWAERLHGIAIESLFVSNRVEEEFEEFHAWELYKGEGAFKGIDEKLRFNAIKVLLTSLSLEGFPFIYGAIDQEKLAKNQVSRGLFGTAHPLSAAFRLCVLGVEDWACKQHKQLIDGVTVDYKDNYLVVVDDTKDQNLKKQLRRSYNVLRSKHPYVDVQHSQNRLWHSHDEMYFGDSVNCVGIQLADLCTYFLERHLLKYHKGHREAADEFFEMVAPHAICAKPQPEWSEFSELLVSHDS